jgi:hypothetical protein
MTDGCGSAVMIGRVKPPTRSVSGVIPMNDVTSFPEVTSGRLPMNYNIESEREEDGRRIAEVPQLPGVLAPMARPPMTP